MKKLPMLILVLSLIGNNLTACETVNSHENLKKYNISKRSSVVCEQVGTHFEGWYYFEKNSYLLLIWNFCSEKKIPECEKIGSRGEGWYLNDEIIKYDFCDNKYIECGAIGSRNEGWYTFKKINYQLIALEDCFKD